MNPVAGIPSANVQPVGVFDEGRTCCCGDAELDTLRALVAGGMGQAEASRLLWGPPISVQTAENGPETATGAMHTIERHRIATEGLAGAQIAITGDVA